MLPGFSVNRLYYEIISLTFLDFPLFLLLLPNFIFFYGGIPSFFCDPIMALKLDAYTYYGFRTNSSAGFEGGEIYSYETLSLIF